MLLIIQKILLQNKILPHQSSPRPTKNDERLWIAGVPNGELESRRARRRCQESDESFLISA